MNKKIWILALITAIVLCGCGQKNSAGKTASTEAGGGAIPSPVQNLNTEEPEQNTETAIAQSVEADEIGATLPDEATLDDSVTSVREYLKEMKRLHNMNPVDFEPTIGEFCTYTEDGPEPVSDSDGDYYGFYDNLTDGCSVWCAVTDYRVEVEATSTLAPEGKQSYDAENILNGSRSSAWIEGAEGNGIGESITITKTYDIELDDSLRDEESIFFYELCIVNGYTRTDKAWKENGRVKKLAFYFNGKYMGDLELEDTQKPQFISLSGLNLSGYKGRPSSFTFRIMDVYPGTKYEDTAITGIEIAFDTPNH